MRVSRWLIGFILSVIIFGLGNFIFQFVLNLLFEYMNYWVASVISIVIALFATNQISQYAFFIIPYVMVKVASMSLYYFFLFNLVLTIVFVSVRTDFYLDNYIPKWLHITNAFLFFITSYGLKTAVKKLADINDVVIAFKDDPNYRDELMKEINESTGSKTK